jgi:hypothetical protein
MQCIAHDIELENTKPIRQRPYKIPHAKQVVNECVDKMLRLNIIEPSNSDWASPIVLVKKPDGSERFCVDYFIYLFNIFRNVPTNSYEHYEFLQKTTKFVQKNTKIKIPFFCHKKGTN